MTTALIAEDEAPLADYLVRRLAELWPELEIVAVAGNGPEAMAALERHAPDLVFLDIRMPGASGLEVARHAGRSLIVFVTAYEQHALEAFEHDAVDYLLKPVTSERLARCIDKLKARLSGVLPRPELESLLGRLAAQLAPPRPSLRWIRASRPGSELVEQIAVSDVLYIQADDKYTCVHARDGESLREWLIRVPLSELNVQLDPAVFAQIHRSVIVNLEAVAGTRRDLAGKLWLRLRGVARELPVARPYVGLFRQM